MNELLNEEVAMMLLSDKPKLADDLSAEARTRFRVDLSPLEAYIVLRGLKREGYAAPVGKRIGGKRAYVITPSGREYAAEIEGRLQA